MEAVSFDWEGKGPLRPVLNRSNGAIKILMAPSKS